MHIERAMNKKMTVALKNCDGFFCKREREW